MGAVTVLWALPPSPASGVRAQSSPDMMVRNNSARHWYASDQPKIGGAQPASGTHTTKHRSERSFSVRPRKQLEDETYTMGSSESEWSVGQHESRGHPVDSGTFLQTHFEFIDLDSIKEIRSIGISNACPRLDGGFTELSTGARSSLSRATLAGGRRVVVWW